MHCIYIKLWNWMQIVTPWELEEEALFSFNLLGSAHLSLNTRLFTSLRLTLNGVKTKYMKPMTMSHPNFDEPIKLEKSVYTLIPMLPPKNPHYILWSGGAWRAGVSGVGIFKPNIKKTLIFNFHHHKWIAFLKSPISRLDFTNNRF